MELLRVVNEHDGSNTDQIMSRKEVICNGLWCSTTNIFVMNSKGHILCHQRSHKKERLPGVWMTHLGGHVGHNEDFDTNAAKEIQEELGLSHSPKLIPWRMTKSEAAKLWIKEYVAIADFNASELKPQEGEVDQLLWLSPNDILEHVSLEPQRWMAGTHHFMTEYYCMRSALMAAASANIIHLPKELQVWK